MNEKRAAGLYRSDHCHLTYINQYWWIHTFPSIDYCILPIGIVLVHIESRNQFGRFHAAQPILARAHVYAIHFPLSYCITINAHCMYLSK